MPRSALLIGWFVLIFLLGAPRFVYRVLKDRSSSVRQQAANVLGRLGADARTAVPALRGGRRGALCGRYWTAARPAAMGDRDFGASYARRRPLRRQPGSASRYLRPQRSTLEEVFLKAVGEKA